MGFQLIISWGLLVGVVFYKYVRDFGFGSVEGVICVDSLSYINSFYGRFV